MSKKNLKTKIKSLGLTKLLIYASLAIPGFFISVFLHNFFYALAELSQHIFVLPQIFGSLEVIFFLVAIFGCPLVLLVSLIIAIWLRVTSKRH